MNDRRSVAVLASVALVSVFLFACSAVLVDRRMGYTRLLVSKIPAAASEELACGQVFYPEKHEGREVCVKQVELGVIPTGRSVFVAKLAEDGVVYAPGATLYYYGHTATVIALYVSGMVGWTSIVLLMRILYIRAKIDFVATADNEEDNEDSEDVVTVYIDAHYDRFPRAAPAA